MGNLYVTIGLPRSGKSTYCKQWAMRTPRRTIVSGDSIRLAMTGQRFNYNIEPFVNATKLVMTKSLLLNGFDVIVDETCTTEKSIREMLQIYKHAEFIV